MPTAAPRSACPMAWNWNCRKNCARYPVNGAFAHGTEATIHAAALHGRQRAATNSFALLRRVSADCTTGPCHRQAESWRRRRPPRSKFRFLAALRVLNPSRQRPPCPPHDIGSVETGSSSSRDKLAASAGTHNNYECRPCMPQPGFLKQFAPVCTNNGALLIFDEVKPARTLLGLGERIFRREPDMIPLAKSSAAACRWRRFGASRK